MLVLLYEIVPHPPFEGLWVGVAVRGAHESEGVTDFYLPPFQRMITPVHKMSEHYEEK